MIVKIEKKSDTEYAKYSDCPDAYYTEIKYDRDKSSFEVRYTAGMNGAKETAERGLVLCRRLYDEAKRIRRQIKKHNLSDWNGIQYYTQGCSLNQVRRSVNAKDNCAA